MILVLLICFLPLILCDQVEFGNVRVQTLSPTLLRVENIGPKGYEDRTTFMVQNRNFKGVPITNVNHTSNGAIVTTQYYSVEVSQVSPPTDTCFGQQGMDVDNPQRSPDYPNGVNAGSMALCCAACRSDSGCNGWVFDPTTSSGVNCWPLNAWSGAHSVSNRNFGCLGNGCYSVITGITVKDPTGKVLLNQQSVGENTNMLHWPSPLSAPAYVVTDFPRFYVPEWGPMPHPGSPFPNTNGYDFTNNQNGDFYIFLLGSTLDSWYASRAEFVQLVGPTPVIPDFAYGTWFTYWYSYTEAEAKSDIAHWKSGNLPLDVYGLDMNWRNTSNNQDHFYNHPNTLLFPNFTEWFSFLHANGLKTYFNDHPFPVDMQTSPTEVGFRYGGLTEWMARGLDYWWFDHNWSFSIPPPNALPVNGWANSNTDGNWLGLDNAAWGSHVYFETVTNYYQSIKSSFVPITLTKFARPDWRSTLPATDCQEHPAHHRYPVWWTGDGVDLQASVQSMVDNGVHDFKPFVHSDCGGDSRGSAGDLLRWTAHCTFGTILRFHGSDHRPWTYDAHTEQVILSYLNMRYKLIPTLIAAGHSALTAGYPLVVRGDLIWPQQSGSNDNTQYIHLNETLVAPIWNSATNMTSRSVWIPPGNWQDAWDGSTVTGPKKVTVSKPYEQIPMWHRMGSFLITVDSPARRVEEQDWSILTLEVFPDLTSERVTEKSVYSIGTAARTDLSMRNIPKSENGGFVQFDISESEDGASRGWLIRLHLRPGQTCMSANVDGNELDIAHIDPVMDDAFFPFRGAGTPPAPKAGKVAEINVPSANHQRKMVLSIF